MQGVETLQELLLRMSQVQGQQAAMRIFNILKPYQKPLPVFQNQEMALNAFFSTQNEDVVPKGGMLTSQPIREPQRNEDQPRKHADVKEQLPKNKLNNDFFKVQESKGQQSAQEQQTISQQVLELKSVINLLTQKNTQKDVINERLQKQNSSKAQEIFQLKKQLDTSNLQLQLDNLKAKNEQLNQEIKSHREKNRNQMIIKKEQQQELSKLERQNASLRNNLQRLPIIDQQAQQIALLKAENSNQKSKDAQLRFRAGQAFLTSIKKQKAQKQFPSQILSSVNDMRDYSTQKISFNDDNALITLLQKAQRQSFIDRIKTAEDSNTGYLNQAEIVKILRQFKTSPQDILSILRFVKESSGMNKLVNISNFIKFLSKRPNQREKEEHSLFLRLHEYITQKGISMEQLFNYFDTNQDLKIDFAQFKNGFQSIGIEVNNFDIKNVFSVIDSSRKGKISLQEFKQKLLEHQKIQSQQGDVFDQQEQLQEIDYLERIESQDRSKTYSTQMVGVKLIQRAMCSKAAEKQKSLVRGAIKSYLDKIKAKNIANQDKSQVPLSIEEEKAQQQNSRSQIKFQLPSPNSQQRQERINGVLILQLQRAFGCIDLATMNPRSYHFVIEDITSDKKRTGLRKIKSKEMDFQNREQTKNLDLKNTRVQFKFENKNVKSLIKNIFIQLYVLTQVQQDFQSLQPVFVGQCTFPWHKCIQKSQKVLKKYSCWHIDSSFSLSRGTKVIQYDITGNLIIRAKFISTKDMKDIQAQFYKIQSGIVKNIKKKDQVQGWNQQQALSKLHLQGKQNDNFVIKQQVEDEQSGKINLALEQGIDQEEKQNKANSQNWKLVDNEKSIEKRPLNLDIFDQQEEGDQLQQLQQKEQVNHSIKQSNLPNLNNLDHQQKQDEQNQKARLQDSLIYKQPININKKQRNGNIKVQLAGITKNQIFNQLPSPSQFSYKVLFTCNSSAKLQKKSPYFKLVDTSPDNNYFDTKFAMKTSVSPDDQFGDINIQLYMWIESGDPFDEQTEIKIGICRIPQQMYATIFQFENIWALNKDIPLVLEPDYNKKPEFQTICIKVQMRYTEGQG